MAGISEVLEGIARTPLAVYMHESPGAFPLVESAHVIAVCMVFGTILMVDLRLLGLVSLKTPVTGLTGELLPLTWGAFALAVVTGFLLFISQPVEYAANTSFCLKMLALLTAGVNMLAFHGFAYRHVAIWDRDIPPPPAARLAGAVSLASWLGVIACGRIIGFTMFPS